MSSTITNGAHGALVVDPSPDVVLQRAFEYPPETVLRVKRSLNTGDNADVPIVVSCKAILFHHFCTVDSRNACLIKLTYLKPK